MRLHVLALFCLPILTLPIQAQWDLQDSHSTASLRGIHNVGGGVAWTSGTNGTVLRTEDGGYLWQTCAVPPGAEKLDFRGIQAFDENTAIVMSSGKGDLSRLYKTTNGCRTWKLVFTNPDKDGFWDALRFEKPNPKLRDHRRRGVLVGDPVAGHFAIFMSNDEGHTWQELKEAQAKAPTGAALFAASNSAAVALGDLGNLAFVTGGTAGSLLFRAEATGGAFDSFATGLKFTKEHLDFGLKAESAGAFSVAVRRIDDVTFDLLVVGGDYKKPDLGIPSSYLPARNRCCFGMVPQRIERSTTPPHGYRSAVAYDERARTWITVGPNGTDISTDDGKNWRALKPKPNEPADADKNWNAVSLPFVVGPNGRIGKLRDDALKP